MKKNEKRPFDAFDTNEPAALIENDAAYDTHGTLADGSFFESFEGDEHPDWIGTDSAILSYADGKMRLESKTFDFKNEAFVYKNITVIVADLNQVPVFAYKKAEGTPEDVVEYPEGCFTFQQAEA